MAKLLDKVTKKLLRIITVVLCAILVVVGFIILIGLALALKTASGRCLLYTHQSGFGPSGVCGYVYAITSLFHVIYCLVRAVLTVLVIFRKFNLEGKLCKKFVVFGLFVLDIIVCLLTLIMSGMISHGFNILCTEVFNPLSDRCGSYFYGADINRKVQNYYTKLILAEAGGWISFILWILLVVVDILLLLKTGILKKVLSTCRRGKSRSRDSNDNAAISRNRSNNQSQRSAVALIFRSGDSDTESGPRTPPPQRPVPPRPLLVKTASAASAGSQ